MSSASLPARRWSIVFLSLIACAALAPNAEAGVITVGTPLNTGTFTAAGAEAIPYLVTNAALSDPGAQVVSPVTGAIVGWHVRETKGFGFQLYTLKPSTETTYTATGATAARTPLTTGLESFPASLSINAGEAIGLLVPPGAEPGLGEKVGEVVHWQPPLALGATGAGIGAVSPPWAFNAEVLPAPTITGVTPSSGTIKGGAAVTITGTQLEGATAVTFGGALASSFSSSETQVTTVAPATAKPESLRVSVTTIAGTATGSVPFTTTACVVPKLAGRKLKAAKKTLKAADCTLGKVTKKAGATGKSGKVKKQSPKAGKVLAPGTKVTVTLKP